MKKVISLYLWTYLSNWGPDLYQQMLGLLAGENYGRLNIRKKFEASDNLGEALWVCKYMGVQLGTHIAKRSYRFGIWHF